jgi:ubiquitin C-terminal hydrolase
MNFKGILNVGNTCYINSAIQCFIHLPLQIERSKCADSEFLKLVLDFYEKYLSSEMCNCRNLLMYLFKFQKDFHFLNLCDAQEALMYLIDLYHENTKSEWDHDVEALFFRGAPEYAVKEWKHYSPAYSLISLMLTFQLEETLLCKNCSKIIQKRFPIFTQMDICTNDMGLLNDGIKKEFLEDYKCENCNEAKCCYKLTNWFYCSDYMIFYNKRKNFFLKSGIKLFMVNQNENVEYELIMTINHFGNHYICYIRDPNMEWHECDDDQVKVVKGPVVNTIYLYIFKKK